MCHTAAFCWLHIKFGVMTVKYNKNNLVFSYYIIYFGYNTMLYIM